MAAITVLLLMFRIGSTAVSHVGSLITVVRDVFAIFGRVGQTLYGVTHSAAGSFSLTDVAHLGVMLLVYFGSALSFSSWVFSDVSSALAYLAAGVAGLVTWLHKLATNPPTVPPAA